MPGRYNTWRYSRTRRARDAIRRRRATAPAVPRYNPRLSLLSYSTGIRRHCVGAELTSATLATAHGAGFALTFAFNQIPGFSATYNALYDQLRLDMVEVTLVPSWNSLAIAPAAAAAVPNRPVIFAAIDKTNATAPSGLGTILQYGNHKMSTGIMKLRLRPQILAVQEDTTLSDDPQIVINNRDGWLPTDNPNTASVNYSGVRVWVDYDWTAMNTPPDPYPQIKAICKYYFSGKCQN